MADYIVQRTYRRSQIALTLMTLFQATKGVFWPGPADPKTWCGRLLRFMGLLCVYAVIAGAVAVLILDFMHGRR